MTLYLASNDTYTQITAATSTATPVSIPAGAIGVLISNLSALNTITFDVNPTDVAATVTLTITVNGGVAAETIVIAGRTYTLRASVATTADEILVEATPTLLAENIVAAINLDRSKQSKFGSLTTANVSVRASNLAGVVTLTALYPGTAGNAITTTETMTNGVFSAATLTGGTNDASSGKGILIPPRAAPVGLEFDPGKPPTAHIYNSDGSTTAAINFTWTKGYAVASTTT